MHNRQREAENATVRQCATMQESCNDSAHVSCTRAVLVRRGFFYFDAQPVEAKGTEGGLWLQPIEISHRGAER